MIHDMNNTTTFSLDFVLRGNGLYKINTHNILIYWRKNIPYNVCISKMIYCKQSQIFLSNTSDSFYREFYTWYYRIIVSLRKYFKGNTLLIEMLKGKIHRATVTEADLDYAGSLTLDEDLMDIFYTVKSTVKNVQN